MNAPLPLVAGAREVDDIALWTGRPGWRSAAVRIWKLWWVAAWFTVLLADGARIALSGSKAPTRAWAGEASLLAVSAAVLAGLVCLSILTARTTRYTVGLRGVTLRYGIALPATLVIPFAAIGRVEARLHSDGSGDVALGLKSGPAAPYAKLWPHARPWRLRRAEPMLRCIPDAGVAAALICRALSARSTQDSSG